MTNGLMVRAYTQAQQAAAAHERSHGCHDMSSVCISEHAPMCACVEMSERIQPAGTHAQAEGNTREDGVNMAWRPWGRLHWITLGCASVWMCMDACDVLRHVAISPHPLCRSCGAAASHGCRTRSESESRCACVRWKAARCACTCVCMWTLFGARLHASCRACLSSDVICFSYPLHVMSCHVMSL